MTTWTTAAEPTSVWTPHGGSENYVLGGYVLPDYVEGRNSTWTSASDPTTTWVAA